MTHAIVSDYRDLGIIWDFEIRRGMEGDVGVPGKLRRPLHNAGLSPHE